MNKIYNKYLNKYEELVGNNPSLKDLDKDSFIMLHYFGDEGYEKIDTDSLKGIITKLVELEELEMIKVIKNALSKLE